MAHRDTILAKLKAYGGEARQGQLIGPWPKSGPRAALLRLRDQDIVEQCGGRGRTALFRLVTDETIAERTRIAEEWSLVKDRVTALQELGLNPQVRARDRVVVDLGKLIELVQA